jgi:hypothetical protein
MSAQFQLPSRGKFHRPMVLQSVQAASDPAGDAAPDRAASLLHRTSEDANRMGCILALWPGVRSRGAITPVPKRLGQTFYIPKHLFYVREDQHT